MGLWHRLMEHENLYDLVEITAGKGKKLQEAGKMDQPEEYKILLPGGKCPGAVLPG